MAICINCGAEIEEGKYLCENCENEGMKQEQTEEYLDNLLDNVQAGSALELLKKNGNVKKEDSAMDIEEESLSEDFATLLGESSLEEATQEGGADAGIVEDELNLAGLDALDNIDFEDMDDLDDIDFDAMEDLSDIDFTGMEEVADKEADSKEEADIPMKEADGQDISNLEELGLEGMFLEEPQEPEEAALEESKQEEPETVVLEESEPEEAALEEMMPEAETAAIEDTVKEDVSEDTDDMDDMLDQLLANLDNEGSVNKEETEEAAVSDEDLDKMMNDYAGSDEEMQDLDELLTMLGDENADAGGEEDSMDMGNEDVFSLDEGDISEEDLLALEGFDEGEAAVDSLFGLDEGEMAEQEPDLAGMLEEEIAIPMPEEAPEQKKEKGFFSKVFGNVVDDDIAQKELENKKLEEEQRQQKEESDAIKKAEKKEKKELKAAEKKEAKAKAKQEKEAKKAEKKALKQAKKEEAAKEEQEDTVEVVGKLNKVGVSIVVILAVVFLAFVTLGTRAFSYSSAIADAKEYYDNKRYTKAYEELLGVEIKEKDKEFYDKVITIMQVNHHIDSYSTYKSLKKFPEALDALLKGLKKYESNYETALDLEIESDMDGCKDTILTSLSDEFDLNEEDAYDIVNSTNQDTYNKMVVDVVAEQMRKVMEQANQ